MSKRLVLLDGNALLYRGFFAMRALTNSAGQPTNAVFALSQMLFTLLEREKPDQVFCAWDAPVKTFRHEMFAEYKGTRQSTPDDLRSQAPIARELVSAFGIPAVEAPGFEADDIIGTLAKQGKELGYEVMVVTGDSDALQLVEPGVRVMITVKGVTDTVLYDEDAVRARYGLEPAQLTDYRALKGDTSDNIPGVPGVGEKTAAALLQKFGTVEEMLRRRDEIAPVRIQGLVDSAAQQIPLSKDLAIIRRDVPLGGVELPDPAAATLPAPDAPRLKALFEQLEFRQLARRIPGGAGAADTVREGSASGSTDPVAEESKPESVSRSWEIRTDLDALKAACSTADGVALRLARDPAGVLVGIAVSPADGLVWWVPADSEPQAATGGLFDQDQSTQSVFPGEVAELLGDSSVPKWCHDLHRDTAELLRHGIELRGATFDTELAAYLVLAGRRSGFALADIAADLAGIAVAVAPTGKSASAVDALPAAKAAAESGADAIRGLRNVLEARLREDGLIDLLKDLELPLAGVLARMEANGLLLDIGALKAFSSSTAERIKELESAIHERAGGVFTIGSPKQLQEVLFERLGLPAGKKTKTGYSTDADVLEELAPQYPIVSEILEWRELSKLRSTYAEALPALADAQGRVHTFLSQTVAATGRLASSNPNLQNIPVRTAVGRSLRRAFVAPAGQVLLSADYSQIELRIFAHLSGDTQMREAFESGEDIHRYTAGKVYGVAPEDVTSDMRRAAKTVNFAVLYGISDFALARQLKISGAEAKALKSDYFARFPSVREWLDRTIAEARENGCVRTLMGRRRWIPDINSRVFNFRQGAERAAANMPVQGASADIMKVAMLRVWEMMENERPPARMLLQVHDELLFEVDRAAAPEFGEKVRACMESAAQLDVHLDVEVKTGANWADVTPVEAGAAV
jgi:DNA polymerase-1